MHCSDYIYSVTQFCMMLSVCLTQSHNQNFILYYTYVYFTCNDCINNVACIFLIVGLSYNVQCMFCIRIKLWQPSDQTLATTFLGNIQILPWQRGQLMIFSWWRGEYEIYCPLVPFHLRCESIMYKYILHCLGGSKCCTLCKPHGSFFHLQIITQEFVAKMKNNLMSIE